MKHPSLQITLFKGCIAQALLLSWHYLYFCLSGSERIRHATCHERQSRQLLPAA